MKLPDFKPDQWRSIFGFCLLLVLASLALIIALGSVTEETSHGLMPLITAIATLSGSFAQWAFSNTDRDRKDK